MSAFAGRLRAIVRADGRTMKEIGRAVDPVVPASGYRSLQNWVHGRSEPRLDGLVRLRRALGCTWEELMGE